MLGRVFKADSSLVVAGALLHDIGKTEAFDWDKGFEPTMAGRQLGPEILGTAMIERRLHPVLLPKLTGIELRELQHIIVVAGDDRASSMVAPLNLSARVVRMANEASVQGTRWARELPDLDSTALFGPEAPPT
jgi:23S rRNA maturation-related 3'-5' exoribonuclease YhaM